MPAKPRPLVILQDGRFDARGDPSFVCPLAASSASDLEVARASFVRAHAGRRQGVGEGVGEAQLDERLSCDTDAPGFLIDGAEQIDGGSRPADPLDFTPGTAGPRGSTYGVRSTPAS